MVKFEIIQDIQQVPQANGWVEVPHFNSKNRIVNAKGEKVGKDYTGHKFVLIKKYEHYFSRGERFVRGCLGILKFFPSLLGCVEFKSVQELFKKKKLTKRFGILAITSETLKNDHVDQSSNKQEKETPCKQPSSSPLAKLTPNLTEQKPAVNLANEVPIIEPLKLSDEQQVEVENKPDIQQDSKPLSHLPSLINLRIESPNPFMPEFYFAKDIKQVPKSYLDWDAPLKRCTDEQGTKIELDKEFFNLSIESFMNRNDLPASDPQAIIMQDPARQDKVHWMQEKVDLLNQNIRMKERLPYLKNVVLTLKDLVPPWHLSHLKYVLMMDEDLSHLTLENTRISSEDNKTIKKIFKKGFISRLIKIKEDKKDIFDPSQLSKGNIGDILLVDVCTLKADTINRLAKHLPIDTFYFIADAEIPSINMKVLSSKKIKALLLDKNKVKQLSTQQLNDSIKKMDAELLTCLDSLDDLQLLALDYSDQSIFDRIFPEQEPERVKKLFQQMKLPQIYKITPNFSLSKETNHWKLLSDDQILNFDYSKIDDHIFGLIFNENTGKRTLLSQMNLSKIYEICHYFNDQDWQSLSKEQILDFDYSQLEQKKLDKQGTFEKMFDAVGDLSFDRLGDLFSNMSDDQFLNIKKYVLNSDYNDIYRLSCTPMQLKVLRPY